MRRAGAFVAFKVLPMLGIVWLCAATWPRVHDWLETSPSLRVKRVLVSGNRFLTPTELITIAGVSPGMPLVAFGRADAEARLRVHPRVRDASVRYVFPRSLRVDVSERVPVALLELDGPRPISEDGVVLPDVPGRVSEDLPVLLPPSDMTSATAAPPDVREALVFLSTLATVSPGLSGSVSLVDLTGERFTRVYLDTLDTAVLYEKGGRWDAHLLALPVVLSELAAEGRRGAVLDFRFREQIVRRGGEPWTVPSEGKSS